jgi:hypothetical protein
LLHCCPAFVGARAPSPVRSPDSANDLTVEAAATLGELCRHGCEIDDFLGSAVTAAKPEGSPMLVSVRDAQCDKSAETLIGDISKRGHDGLFDRRLCQETARRFRAGPSRHYSTARLQ